MFVFGLDPRSIPPDALEFRSKVLGPRRQDTFVQLEEAAAVDLKDDVRVRTEFEETLEEELVLVETSRGHCKCAQDLTDLVCKRAISASLAVERIRFTFGAFVFD